MFYLSFCSVILVVPHLPVPYREAHRKQVGFIGQKNVQKPKAAAANNAKQQKPEVNNAPKAANMTRQPLLL